jgi:hypothetical protein
VADNTERWLGAGQWAENGIASQSGLATGKLARAARQVAVKDIKNNHWKDTLSSGQ